MNALHLITRFLRRELQRRRVLQIAVLCALWVTCEGARRALGIPVPGSVIGIGVLLLLLFTGRMEIVQLRAGAYWLLGEMLLFFVPLVLAVLNHPEYVGALGLKIGAVILVGTVSVMASTALTVNACSRWTAAVRTG